MGEEGAAEESDLKPLLTLAGKVLALFFCTVLLVWAIATGRVMWATGIGAVFGLGFLLGWLSRSRPAPPPA